jgi:predicted dehydrogenase
MNIDQSPIGSATPASTSRVPLPSRRDFLETSGKWAAVSALAGVALPHVHAAEDNTIRLAIVGCGGRGSGAVANALSSPNGPCKLVAMADLFADKLNSSHQNLLKQFKDKIEVPEERRFLGFDAYQKAIDCLRPGDVALLTTHAAFRAPHFEYAIRKGVNVFMEKSFAADPGGIQRILRAGEAAQKKNLKVATGLMCRHSHARQALIQKMRDGTLGDIHLIRAYRMQAGGQMGPHKPDANELVWQIRHVGACLWISTGTFLDNMIHQIDECCWIKDSWPVSAHGVGGRVAQSTDCSQNLDNYAVEYTFADGAKAMVNGRFVSNCYNEFATFVHGTQCAAQFSGTTHAATTHLYRNQRTTPDNIVWRADRETANPWQVEWDDLLESIRKDRPHNETQRSAYSNLAGIMGRAAVHSGRMITWEEATASTFQFCANVDALGANSTAPVNVDAQGRYPAPIAGKWNEV